MNSEDIEAYTVEARKSSDKARKSSDGEYLSVHLPEEIQSLGFKEGDTVYLDLSSSEVDGHEIFFLKGSKEEISRHGLKIRKRPDSYPRHFVSIPIEYTFHREGQSFHGLQPEDELNIELDRNEEEFRIYMADDFRYRSKQVSDEYGLPPVVKQPAVGFSVLGSAVSSMDDKQEYVRFTDDLPDEITTNSSAEIIGEVSGKDIDNIHLQRAVYVNEVVTWRSVSGIADFEGAYTKIYCDISHEEEGEYEYRIIANYEEAESLNSWDDSDSDVSVYTGDEDLVSEIHTVTVVESEDE